MSFSRNEVVLLPIPFSIKSQIATIEDRLVLKSVGILSPTDAAALQSRVRAWLGL